MRSDSVPTSPVSNPYPTPSQANHKLSLVDGTFPAIDAKKKILKTINDEMVYHSLQNFSSKQRMGETNKESENKLKELRQFNHEVSEIVKAAEDKGLKIQLETQIKISIVDDK